MSISLIKEPASLLAAIKQCVNFAETEGDLYKALSVSSSYCAYTTCPTPDDAYVVVRRLIVMHVYSYRHYSDDFNWGDYTDFMRWMRETPKNRRGLRLVANIQRRMNDQAAIAALLRLYENVAIDGRNRDMSLWLRSIISIYEAASMRNKNHREPEKTCAI